MVKHSRPRLVVAPVLVALVLTLIGIISPVAMALPAEGPTTLAIHKLEQPEEYGSAASGHEQDTTGMTPIDGVTFTATLVPGIDPSTVEGMEQAQALTIPEALLLIAGQAESATGVTGEDGTGQLDLSLLPGLYLIQEISGPAGIVESAPFLVPMPYVDGTGQTLATVHVYPKNAVVDATLTVADREAVSCGNSVEWASYTDIPHQRSVSAYVVENVVADGLAAPTPAAVTVALSGHISLTSDDYTNVAVTIDGRAAIRTTFSKSGLAKLGEARVMDPAVQVVIKYSTVVSGPGIHTNEVRLLAGENASSRATLGSTTGAGTPPVTATATTKFGPLQIIATEKGNPSNRIPGATFRLYTSAEDAAAGRNPITIDGKDLFTTDANGQITIGCLRFSDYVDGLDRDPSDPLYRNYVAVPQSYPAGWTGDMAPKTGLVNEVATAIVLDFEAWKETPPGPKPPNPLPDTGARVAGAAALGAVLLGAGGLMVARRRDEDDERSEET